MPSFRKVTGSITPPNFSEIHFFCGAAFNLQSNAVDNTQPIGSTCDAAIMGNVIQSRRAAGGDIDVRSTTPGISVLNFVSLKQI